MSKEPLPNDEEKFLTPDEVMRSLRISKQTFYNMVNRGEIPGAFKIGAIWRINPEILWSERPPQSRYTRNEKLNRCPARHPQQRIRCRFKQGHTGQHRGWTNKVPTLTWGRGATI